MLAPLSRYLSLTDYDDLRPELAIVDREDLGSQASTHRRWEYALALRALEALPPDARIVDVGGAGSPFHRMTRHRSGTAEVVDPQQPGGLTLAQYLQTCPRLADAVTCLSVLEHVDDLWDFCYHLSCLVRPGGLLVLTLDATDSAVQDSFHFHWMRKRIFDRGDLQQLLRLFDDLECRPESDPSWQFGPYPGAFVYDYTFASLVLRKHR